MTKTNNDILIVPGGKLSVKELIRLLRRCPDPDAFVVVEVERLGRHQKAIDAVKPCPGRAEVVLVPSN
jgi:hypothetical protein